MGTSSPAMQAFDESLTAPERRAMARLTSPTRIQAFLDTLTYSHENMYRSPLRVLRERTGHCFDGGIFASHALRLLGYPPLILDMLPNARDDDHLLALYKADGHWGAVAKSNFAVLRSREPVYRTVRELVMSYFDVFYNVRREKTLRGYTVPLHLKTFDRFQWTVRDEAIDLIADRLGNIRSVRVLTRGMIARLKPVDMRLYRSGLLGAKPAGLYQPPKKKTDS